jgi:hypothetical protein
LPPPASCAIDNAGNTSVANAKRNATKTPAFSLPDREFTGKTRIRASFIEEYI